MRQSRLAKQVVLATTVAAMAVSVAACSGSSGGGTTSSGGRPTIRFAIDNPAIGTLDPVRTVAGDDRMITYMLYDGLVRYPPGDVTGAFQPGISTNVPKGKLTPDGHQTWTFDIRKGVVCPAGPKSPKYDLTAADVVNSLTRAADPKRSNFATYYRDFSSIKALNAQTVQVTLDKPMTAALFLPLVSDWGPGQVTCKKAVDAEGDAGFGNFPIGTGPFTFASYVPGQKLKLVANDDYWRGKPKAAGWTIQPIADENARRLALLGGSVDVAMAGADEAWFKSVGSDRKLYSSTTPILGTTWIVLNTKIKPLDDIRVRKAIFYALDRKSSVQLAGGDIKVDGKPLAGPTLSFVNSSLLPGGLSNDEVTKMGLGYDFDLGKARALMAESGHANGFTLHMTSSSGAKTDNQHLQAELKKINIKLDIKYVDLQTFHKDILNGKSALVSELSYRPTMDIYLTEYWDSASNVVGGSEPAQNYAMYGGADKYIDAARATTDPAKQIALWKQANAQLLKDAVCKPMLMIDQTYTAVKGFTFGPPTLKSIPNNWMADWRATIKK